MRMRKLFAGVVAAATMLGGLALGASTANADETTDATVTVKSAQPGHTYTAYKFATFANPVASDTEGTLASVNVNVADASWNTAIKTALDKDPSTTPSPEDAALYANNFAAYVATFDAAKLRTFANNFALPTPAPTAAGSVTNDGTEAADKAISTGLTEGWYFVFDTLNGKAAGPLGVVATQITDSAASKIYTKFTLDEDATTGQTPVQDALGEMVAKAQVPDQPNKEVSGDTEGTAKVGQELTYTVTAAAPKNLASYESYDFTFTDVPGTGLTLAAGTASTLTVNGLKLSEFVAPATATASGNLTAGFDGNGATAFTVTLNKAAIEQALAKDSEKLVLSYTATVNESAVDKVTNKATVTTNSGTSGEGTTTTYVGDFNFKKIGVDGDKDGLAGAEFEVYATDASGKETGAALKFTGSNGVYVLAKDQTTGTSTLTSSNGTDNKGTVKVNGLAKGTYVVKETKAPTGYAQNFKVTFKVTIDAKGNATFAKDALGQVQGTADGSSVLNVKTLSQLPLTGAAGTALFTVIGLLLAGAAATVALKSRETKRALRA